VIREDCIFCQIAARKIPATETYRDEDVVAIADASPQAPLHLLVLPVRHVSKISDFSGDADAARAGALFRAAARLGAQGAPSGFRLVVNEGEDGGQTVGHLHVHVLGGRAMRWPPG